MKFIIDKQEKYTLIKLEEDKLDATIAPGLKAEFVNLNTQGVVNLVLDLSSTRYCDSSGLSAILTGNRIASENDGVLILAGLQPMVLKLIELSQLHKIFEILPTQHEAIEFIMMTEFQKELNAEDGEE
ncbi:MAG: anti-anti-sigma factor [Cytophagales bacterium CG12_big_fil_rev_8_21_14_0_65_40_12]|nr:MAG: anti-anti-sigma factor [Cytophagales bacterium CG12_big_fil_rev_8_21_14_0_65_40_12]